MPRNPWLRLDSIEPTSERRQRLLPKVERLDRGWLQTGGLELIVDFLEMAAANGWQQETKTIKDYTLFEKAKQ